MGRYVGKFEDDVERKVRIPLISWALVLLAVLGLSIGGVVAYLSTYTASVENTFTKDTSTDPSVVETFENNVKTDVKVDVGDPGYAVYVRAAVVVTWKSSKDGNVLGKAPVAGTDYTIEFGDDWKYYNGFYYYKTAVNADETNNLIVSCTPADGKTPEGYSLNVEIIAQTIQALGQTDGNSDGTGVEDAVKNAWGIEKSEFITQTP